MCGVCAVLSLWRKIAATGLGAEPASLFPNFALPTRALADTIVPDFPLANEGFNLPILTATCNRRPGSPPATVTQIAR
jgi:hypothetical protein